jgi:hypothetical protein
MMVSSHLKCILLVSVLGVCDAFVPISTPALKTQVSPSLTTTTTSSTSIVHPKASSRKDSALFVLLDVPEGFFTMTFFGSGILLQVSKNFGRLRMEERAWEQRLNEGRQKRIREDPTLTEIELRRKEAGLEWSAYGKPRMDEEREMQGSRSRVKVMDRVEENEDDDAEYRQNRMSDQEIDMFEMEYGIDYDPYYDDPYTEDELPVDVPFNDDRKYGDRIYKDGEIFYKDKTSGLFYRQGAKPRNLSFWG